MSIVKSPPPWVDETKETAPLKRGRTAEAARRAAILDCADAVFLEVGFQAASMSEIAARLGGSKGTLYNYFDSKEDLFLACVRRHCATLETQMSSLYTEGGEPRDVLQRLGKRYVAFVSSDETVRKFRMIVAEAERAPDLARAFYETGPARGVEMLSAYLEKAMQAGALRPADPRRAAQQFLSLCNNNLSKARLCNYAPAPDEATIAADVDDAVRIFLTSYEQTPAGGSAS
jgi:AcrR family transcriptional regulator